MYIEILHEVVQEHLNKEGDKRVPIKIEISEFIYDTLQYEINEVCKINSEVPIEKFEFSCLYMYERSVTLLKGKTLDFRFERRIVERLSKLRIFEYREQNEVKINEFRSVEGAK